MLRNIKKEKAPPHQKKKKMENPEDGSRVVKTSSWQDCPLEQQHCGHLHKIYTGSGQSTTYSGEGWSSWGPTLPLGEAVPGRGGIYP